MSLSFPVDTFVSIEKAKTLYEKIIQDLLELGILVVAAAGNQASKTERFPAMLENIISVGAIDVNNQKSNFSNYSSDWVKVAAPGSEIITTSIPFLENLWRSYIIENGTSLATPIVCGVLALIYDYVDRIKLYFDTPQKKAEFIRETLYNSAISDPQTKEYWKYGRVDALRAIERIPIPRPPFEEQIDRDCSC